MPAFAPPADLGANCQYPPSQDAATKPVEPPPSGRVSTTPGRSATISTNYGDIGIKLATNESPCTVNSFVSLVKQQFYNNTLVHPAGYPAQIRLAAVRRHRERRHRRPGVQRCRRVPGRPVPAR